MCKVPPGVLVLRSVERPIHSFSFYLLCGRSLLMPLKGTTFVSHTLKLQCKPTQITGGKQNRRESAVPWHPSAVWYTGWLWADGCHLTWQYSSSLESFGAFSQKDKIYMILEREGDCLTYGLEFSLPFKSSLTCNIDSSFKRWKKRWRTRENKVKNNLNYHIISELQWLPWWGRWPTTLFDSSMCCQGPGPEIRSRGLWSTCRE